MNALIRTVTSPTRHVGVISPSLAAGRAAVGRLGPGVAAVLVVATPGQCVRSERSGARRQRGEQRHRAGEPQDLAS